MNSPHSLTSNPWRRRLRSPWFKVAIVALVLLLAWVIHLARDKPNEKASDGQAAMTVTAAVVRSADWNQEFSASGAIEAWQEAVIGSQSVGLRLAEVRVNVGDAVQRGQVLARFDGAMLRAEESQLVATVAQAKATLAQASANRQRAVSLRTSGGISEQDILQTVTTADIAKAELDSANAQLAAKRLQLKYTEVLAPDAGVISARTATLGAVMGAGEELFRLIRQGRLEWRAELTPEQLQHTSVGQKIDLVLPDGNSAQATIRQTAPALNSTSRLGLAYADVQPGSSARAGMYATGRLLLDRKSARIVPATSVIIRDGTSFVASLDEGSPLAKVSLNQVQVGRRQGNDLELLTGAAVGTRVVVQGAGFLDEGDLVRVVAASVATVRARP